MMGQETEEQYCSECGEFRKVFQQDKCGPCLSAEFGRLRPVIDEAHAMSDRSSSPNVTDMVKYFLARKGANGLRHPEAGCTCAASGDLMGCGEWPGGCRATVLNAVEQSEEEMEHAAS